MLIAQITDTHVLDPAGPRPAVDLCDPAERLTAAVERLAAEPVAPEALLLTGDLVDGATPAAMETLTGILGRVKMPILAVPGNHDERAAFRTAFDQPYAGDPGNDDDAEGHLGWVVDLGPVVMIGLDTLDPPGENGRFDAERREWLASVLAAHRDRPVAVAMHHPPFVTGIEAMDANGLTGADEFAATIAAHPQVTRVFCGHLHRPIIATVGGATVSVGISTVQAVALDLTPGAALAVADEPAGYSLHRFTGSSWVTHTRYIHPAVPAHTVSAYHA